MNDASYELNCYKKKKSFSMFKSHRLLIQQRDTI